MVYMLKNFNYYIILFKISIYSINFHEILIQNEKKEFEKHIYLNKHTYINTYLKWSNLIGYIL